MLLLLLNCCDLGFSGFRVLQVGGVVVCHRLPSGQVHLRPSWIFVGFRYLFLLGVCWGSLGFFLCVLIRGFLAVVGFYVVISGNQPTLNVLAFGSLPHSSFVGQ